LKRAKLCQNSSPRFPIRKETNIYCPCNWPSLHFLCIQFMCFGTTSRAACWHSQW
jgi:hypothetical protein